MKLELISTCDSYFVKLFINKINYLYNIKFINKFTNVKTEKNLNFSLNFSYFLHFLKRLYVLGGKELSSYGSKRGLTLFEDI